MLTQEMLTGQIKKYPYRTARVRDVFLTLPRRLLQELENELAKKSGAMRDNHVVYAVTQEGYMPTMTGETVYVFISDLTITFGHTLVEGSW